MSSEPPRVPYEPIRNRPIDPVRNITILTYNITILTFWNIFENK